MQWSRLVLGLMFVIITRNVSAQYIEFNDNNCETPNGKPGICLGIRKCIQIAPILEQKPLAHATQIFLKKSLCGFDRFTPKICCEMNINESNFSSINPVHTVRPKILSMAVASSKPISKILEPPNVTNHPNLGLLNHSICGPISSNRIMGTNKTGLFEFPWTVLLVYKMEGRNSEFRCGGSVISQRYILTAAHCVTNLTSDMTLFGVRIGEHDVTKARDCEMTGTFEEVCAEKYQDISVEKAEAHPNYSLTELQNDIALLRLKENIDFGPENAKPICLPIGPASKMTSKTMMVTGWGFNAQYIPSAVMLKAAMVRFPQDDCAVTYGSQTEISQKQICMSGQNSTAACSSDSGGPLQAPTIYNGHPRYVQYGISSFGVKDCDTEHYPTVFTRLDFYLDWILNTMRP